MKIASILATALFLIYSALLVSACQNENVGGAPPENVSVSQLIGEADNVYKERADLTKLRQGIELLRRARMVDGNNYEAAWKFAKFCYFLGDNAAEEKDRKAAFKDGISAARAASKLEPEKPDGHFWLAANMGGEAQLSLLGGAANVSEIRQNLLKVVELQPDYHHASAYAALARLELKTRNFFGGSTEKAIEYAETALKIEKDNALVYLTLGEAYLAAKRKSEARQTLETLLKKSAHPDFVPEHSKIVEQAKQLIDKKLDR
jgi:tetratricopeptide (TPR) repeat protein